MDNKKILKLLNDVKNNKISIEDAVKEFRDFPFKDLDFAKLDFHRDMRKKLGEAVPVRIKHWSS